MDAPVPGVRRTPAPHLPRLPARPRALLLGAAAVLVPLVAGCALPGRRADPPATDAREAAEPTVTPVTGGGPRYFEPAAAEQDARLATELAALLAGMPQVRRAYLARVRQGEDARLDVLTLCIVADAPVSDDVVRRIGRAFAATHGATGMLDVLELGAAQERVLALRVEPFYGQPLPSKETPP